MRSTLALCLLLWFCSVAAQDHELKRKQLIGEWFTSNDDSLFFKADTLVLLKRSDNNMVLDKMCVSPQLAKEQGLLNCMEFGNMWLQSRNRVDIWLYEGYSSEVWLSPVRWDLEDEVITIEGTDFQWQFELMLMDTVRFFDEAYSYYDKYAIPRLTLLRIHPDSVPEWIRIRQSESVLQVLPSSLSADTIRMLQEKHMLRHLQKDDSQ